MHELLLYKKSFNSKIVSIISGHRPALLFLHLQQIKDFRLFMEGIPFWEKVILRYFSQGQ